MSTDVLDENVRRIFRRCTPRLTGDDLDRAFARFEGRRRAAPGHARVVAAAAAAFLLAGVLGWLALSPPRPATTTPAQAQPQDVDRLIADLGSVTPEVREKAKNRLVALGAAALAPLERAIYHEDPEVRINSQIVAKTIRRAEEIRPTLAFIRTAVKIARARWAKRDFTNLEAVVTDAFDPEGFGSYRYIPRKTVGAAFDNNTLTPEIVAALDRNDGIVYLDPKGDVLDLGPLCLFTLPDKVGWSAYVMVGLLKHDAEENGLLCIFAVPDGEGDVIFQPEGVAFQPGGGLKIVGDLDPKSNFSKVFHKGDILRTINGKAPAGFRDLDPLCVASPLRTIVSVDRDGKLYSVGVSVIMKVAIKPSPKGELEAKDFFEHAEQALAGDPAVALRLYTEFLTKYAAADFLTKERKATVRERIATLKENLKEKKQNK